MISITILKHPIYQNIIENNTNIPSNKKKGGVVFCPRNRLWRKINCNKYHNGWRDVVGEASQWSSELAVAMKLNISYDWPNNPTELYYIAPIKTEYVCPLFIIVQYCFFFFFKSLEVAITRNMNKLQKSHRVKDFYFICHFKK